MWDLDDNSWMIGARVKEKPFVVFGENILVKSKDDHYNNNGIKLLTKNKIYEVKEGLIRSSTYYYLSDDIGNISFWEINRFITISEHRDIIIKDIIK